MRPAEGPSTVTLAAATDRYRNPTTTTAMPAERGMSCAGRRNSAARWVIASQPAKLHTSSAAAWPTASQPCGANGCRFAVRACGADASTAASSSATSSADNTSCMRPDTVTPNAFAADTVAISAAAVTMTVVCPPPVTAATYAPPNIAAAGAPAGTAK